MYIPRKTIEENRRLHVDAKDNGAPAPAKKEQPELLEEVPAVVPEKKNNRLYQPIWKGRHVGASTQGSMLEAGKESPYKVYLSVHRKSIFNPDQVRNLYFDNPHDAKRVAQLVETAVEFALGNARQALKDARRL